MSRGERIVFFDVGNVLIDDDPFLCEAFRLIHRAMPAESPRARLERFLGDVERALRYHGHLAVERMGSRCLGKEWPKVRRWLQQELDKRWWHLVRAIPRAREALGSLKERFRLGIIANQPPMALDFLEREGLLSLFEVVILDSQHQARKPDVALYRIALEEAKVDPPEALMVGDRLDNDVIPSRRIGMRALLLWLDAREKAWTPRDKWGELMLPVLERLPAPRWDNILPAERPMAMVRSWAELQDAVDSAWEASL